jgi:hypothetical protein
VARYSKVDRRIWNDASFRSFSERGKLVFLFVLTHPNLTMLGAMRATVPGLAAELEMPLEGFAEAFEEGLSKGLVKHDPSASCLRLPNFLKYNRPESPNVVRAWPDTFDLIPECDLKCQLLEQLKAFVEGLSEGFREAFAEGFQKTSERLPEGLAESVAVTVAVKEMSSDESSSGDSETTKKKKRFSAEDIERVRLAYPLKKAPGAARKAIGKAMERLGSRDESDPAAFLIARIAAWKAARDRDEAAGRFVPNCPYPATWMNAESYDEESLQPVKNCRLPDGKPCTEDELQEQTGWTVVRGGL